MALFGHHLPQSAAPLNRITNEAMAETSSHETNRGSGRKHLRRTGSSRSLRPALSSSESLIPEGDSIYNAEALLSRECLPLEGESLTTKTCDVSAALSSRLSPRNSHNALSTSHSKWPAPQLHPIMEQTDTLRHSRSLPRLRASPERTSKVVQPQISIHSIHPNHSHWHPKGAQSPITLDRRRSLSLNDLDCPPKHTISGTRHSPSSSGDEPDQRNSCPLFPVEPIHSPPHRVPTPPGLPSYGTQQATHYRLTQQQRTSRLSFWNRIWPHSQDESDDQMAMTSSSNTSPVISPENGLGSPSGDILRRTLEMIGMTRMVSPPLPSSAHPRAPLPPGVYTTNVPGPLARADDGTFIRGRFGPRSSGHGIGSRNLESHPLSRLGQLSAIEEQVREIDKACERSDLENALRSSEQEEFGMPSPLQEDGRDEYQRRPSQLHPGDQVSRSPPIYLSPPSASPSPPPLDLQSTSPPREPAGWLGPRQSRSPTTIVARMRQGPGYTPSTLLSLRSLDSVTGLSILADDSECARVREMVIDEKRREQRSTLVHIWYAVDDCCHGCWQMLCVRRSSDGLHVH